MDTYRSKRVKELLNSDVEPAGNTTRTASNQYADNYRSSRVTALLSEMDTAPESTVSLPESSTEKKKEKTVNTKGGTFLGGFSYYGAKRREQTAEEKAEAQKQQQEYLKEYQRLLSLDTEALSKEVDAAKKSAAENKPQYQIRAFGGYDTTQQTEEQKAYSALLSDLNKAKSVQYDAKGAAALEGLSAEERAAVETLATEKKDTAKRQAAWSALQELGYSDSQISELVNYQVNIPQRQKNAENYAEMQEAAETYAETNPGLATLASVPANLLSGIGTIDAAVRRIYSPEKEPDYKSAAMLPYAYASTARGTVSQNLEKDHGEAASFLYGVGTSILDSAATAGLALTGVPAGLASSLLGGAAATDAMVQARERGLSDDQAIVTGVAAGVFETFFEKFSLEKLITLKAPTGTTKQRILGTLKNTLKQAGVEGSEELATSAANLLFDRIANGQMSDVQQRIYAYMAGGMDYDEAASTVKRETIQEMATEFAAGALAGGVMGGATTTFQTAYQAKRDKAYQSAVQRARDKANIKGEYTASKDGKTSYDGEEVTIEGMDGEGKLLLSNGKTVEAKEVDFADQKTAEVYEGLAGSDILTPAAQSDIAKAYEGKQDSHSYVLGAEEAYRAGSIGLPMDKMSRDGFNTELSASQKQLAYDLGAAMRTETVKEKVTLSEGGIVYEQGVDAKSLTERQKASVKVAEAISKGVGGKVHLYSTSQNGEGVRVADQESIRKIVGEGKAPNGFYDHRTGDIYIDINAGKNGEGTILYTLGHEYTHMMRQQARADFEKLAEYLFTQLNKSGKDVDALVLAKREKLGVDYDMAYEEVVADCMEAILTDTDAAGRLAALRAENRTLWDKLKEMVDKLLEGIRSLYQDLAPQSEEGRYVREMGDALEKLSDLFVEGLSHAGTESGTGEAGISFSVREIRDNTERSYGVGVYLDSTLLENLTDKERIQMVKERVKELGGQSFTAYDKNGNEVDIQIAEPQRKFKNNSGKLVPVNRDLTTKDRTSATKQEAVVLANELIETASFDGRSAAKYPHDWLDNYGKNDWQYWTTYIQGKNNTVWKATLNIAESKNGEKILYDIGPIKKVEGRVKSRPTATDTSIRNSGSEVKPENEATGKIVETDENRYAFQQRDSAGRELSQQQQAYFKDSKVRDAEGRLKVVYHGSAAQFTEFSADFMSTHGSSEGQGFYFTDNRNMADGYHKSGGQLLEGYLDIKNPLSDSEVTLTAAKVKRLIKAIDPTGDDLVLNYDPMGGMGYPSKAWYDRSLSATVNAVMSTSDSDSEILAELANAGGNSGIVLDKARSVLGYDGYIVEGKYTDATVYVAFGSDQFKNIDNQTPTDNPDIRYQQRGASDREILASAQESAAQNPREREVLAEYKDAVGRVEGYEARLRENRAKVKELSAQKGKKHAKQIKALENEIRRDESRVRTVNDQLTKLEEAQSLKNLLAREKAEILAQQNEQIQQLHERLEEYRKKYGVFPGGERAARKIELPKKSSEREKISQTVRTILEASATPEADVPTIEEMALDGKFSYETYSDKAAIADAASEIRRVGWAQALNDWQNAVAGGSVSKKNTAMGWALYNNAANSGDTETAINILSQMVEHQRNAAQALQATRILKGLSPETQLYQAQRSVENLQTELNKKFGDGKAPELKIDTELAEQFMTAKNQEERDAVLRNIYRSIGKQMPSRFVDKWNAWRYLAMLGNARTHVRNVVGNAGFVPVVAAKNAVATGIESAVYRISGGKTARTKALVTGKGGKALLKAAAQDYARVQDVAMGGGKYSDFANANQYIEEGRVIFQSKIPGIKQVDKALEKARKANSKALDQEDVWFSKPHYAYAMAQYCKANNITAEQVESGTGDSLAKAREYAILEAQKATYRDTNSFSQAVSELGRTVRAGNNGTRKAISTVMEGILPFRKTPANILVRGIEYSPIGLLNGIKQATVDVRRGKKTAAEAIDSISAGLTGTGLLCLGVYLAAQGLVRGHGDDDTDENDFAELSGHQAYALELPDGTSITLDWLAPECLPFFIGVNLWELTDGGSEVMTMADALNAVTLVSEPLLEMSCLQSLNEVFDAVGYASSNDLPGMVKALASAGTSYMTQALPTLLGQIERSGEDIRYTTYTEKDSALTADMQYTLGKASARIPGVDYQQIPYIDAWGRTESSGGLVERIFNNFLNPAYVSQVSESDMEKELLRLYEATGEGGVLPDRAGKSVTVDGTKINLTGEQYVKFAQTRGGKAYEWLNTLTKNAAYQKLSDAEKADCVQYIYEAAAEVAKGELVSGYEKKDWVAEALKGAGVVDTAIVKTKYSDVSEKAMNAYKEYGSSIGETLFFEAWDTLKEMTGEDYNGDGQNDAYSKMDKKLAWIDQQNLTAQQKRALAIANGISEKNIDKRAPWN